MKTICRVFVVLFLFATLAVTADNDKDVPAVLKPRWFETQSKVKETAKEYDKLKNPEMIPEAWVVGYKLAASARLLDVCELKSQGFYCEEAKHDLDFIDKVLAIWEKRLNELKDKNI